MGSSDSNYTQQFLLFPELPYEIRALIWRFSFCRPIQVQLELDTCSIPALLPQYIQRLCKITFSYDKNTIPPALHTCKESRDIALAVYDCFPPPTIHNRICPPDLPTIYYCPLYDNIYLEGVAELVEYAIRVRLRPPEVKTFAMEISAFAASQFAGSPMKVSWIICGQQSIDRGTGISE
ncbi:hypothetical protein DL98DRAFT_257124 [Cadophora sp. DSE1049]|nr:hypothetical protein DL98DRAFT_257124 [Cadophora sp. DSE1049]